MIPFTIRFIFWTAKKLGLLKYQWVRKQKEFYFNHFQDKESEETTEENIRQGLNQLFK